MNSDFFVKITNTKFMNYNKRILITAIITLIVFVFSPQIYNLPIFEYNIYRGKPHYEFTEQLEKDNLLLNKGENEIRAMTLNLLAHYTSWGGTPVNERSHIFFALRDIYSPDILGVQEMCNDWYNEITKNKSSYKFVAPIKTAFPQKMTAIIYNSETLEVIDCGNKSFPNMLNYKSRRIVWAVFKVKKTNKIFTVLNTHLSFIKKNEYNENFSDQACQVNELYTTLQTIYSQYSYPILIIGDFNTKRRVNYQNNVISTGSYGILNSRYTDAEILAKNKFSGENMSFNNTLNDHIFIYGDIKVKNLALLSQECFVNLSDHFPLLADFSL